MYRHVVGVGSQRSEIAEIAAQDGTARFRHGDDDSVDRRPSTGESPEGASTTGQAQGKLLDDA